MERSRASQLLLLILFIPWSLWADNGNKIKIDDRFFVQHAGAEQIKIMSFNTQNLYDTEHDQDYFDYTFLPLNFPGKIEKCETITSQWYRKLCLELDWTPPRLNKKIEQISRVVRGHGSLPDILALQEVENENVVRLLADRLGYSELEVTNQVSRRGQDLALLWNDQKLELLEITEVPAPLRPILRTTFRVRISNDVLVVYSNHWPAQSAPTYWRRECAEELRQDINRLRRVHKDAGIILLGDFNVTFAEEDEVFAEVLLDQLWQHHFVEAHQLSRKWFPQFAENFPDGTYWSGGHRNRWQRFDRIFVSNNFIQKKPRAEIKSYRIIYSQFLTGTTFVTSDDQESITPAEIRYPLSYNFLETPGQDLGYSDHLPVTINLSF